MRHHIELPSQDKLLELFSYSDDTGILKWRHRRKGVNADMVAGVNSRGYIVVRIDGVLFRAHRIIWKIKTGCDPYDKIDHKDLDRANNRWINLREADNSKNMMNAGLSVANKSGVKDVFWDAHAKGWRARIKLSGKNHHIGVFADFGAATSAVNAARERLHGEFARAA